ncbi:uncharacterized protein PFL1_05178 [Pseudozyma flocculosa PF-1]|uniref:Mediator of RNA polymerase II transcription subunit 7 n=2 Tax=Pseudozyma flocculosa TaxID=84751 RepID=A0A5C3F543_9BASI|nr:uncharacterized protein PFL1_05178 [Pseudozyma flocculosa PF-1]EPQ27255.1 hypothetical protein PFL1_05178 [Pseudozyma flocculosa PF-1]SPO39624.1 related to MED7 - member of RNA Polymerase II transcriptional regulation mediator complex [Pseudozyma flocculosa]
MDAEHDQQQQQQQADANGTAGAAQISTSFFPPPPQVYLKYTRRNLALLSVLQSHRLGPEETPWEFLDPEARMQRQTGILRDHLRQVRARKRRRKLEKADDAHAHDAGGDDVKMQEAGFADGDEEAANDDEELPDFDLLLELDRPKVEWIEEDGGYTVFGQHWPIPDVTPTLEELGIPTILPPSTTADRKQQLTTLLQSLLHTYRALTSDLLRPAQPYDVWVPAAAPDPAAQEGAGQPVQPPMGFWTQSTEAKDRLQHIQNVVINMQFLINELRPTQARETLKLMMQMQLQRRREETALIRQRCEQMREKVESIRRMVRDGE